LIHQFSSKISVYSCDLPAVRLLVLQDILVFAAS
jgi:hypothetical protein